MEILNFNFFSVLFFLIIIFILSFFLLFKKQNFFRNIFLFLSFFTIFLSIFGIKIFKQEKQKIFGNDVVFVLDVSKSMNIADIKDGEKNEFRLDFAKKIISDFVLENIENRYSLIIFSGEAKVVVPFTDDLELFLNFLKNVDYKNLTKQGSNFFEGISLANNRFLYSENENKAIIFISDGGDVETEVSEKIADFNGKKSFYFVLGVGSDTGGKIFLGQDSFGKNIFQKNNMEDVILKINEENLKKIANFLGGKYLKIEKTEDLEFLKEELKNFEKTVFLKNNSGKYVSFSRTLAFFSFLFFFVFLLIYIFDFKKYEK